MTMLGRAITGVLAVSYHGSTLVNSFTYSNTLKTTIRAPLRNVVDVRHRSMSSTPLLQITGEGIKRHLYFDNFSSSSSEGSVSSENKKQRENIGSKFLIRYLSLLTVVLGKLVARPTAAFAAEAVVQTTKNTMVIGSLKLWLKSIFTLKPGSIARGWSEMIKCWDFEIFAFLSFFSLATVPGVRFLRQKLGKPATEDSFSMKSSQLLTTGARLASSVYAIELCTEFIDGVVNHEMSLDGYVLGERFFNTLPEVYASIAFGYWFMLIAQSGFSATVDKIDEGKPNLLLVLYKRIFSVISLLVYVSFVLNVAAVDSKKVLNALLALGGVSSFVVGLALQEPAARLISGVGLLLRGEYGAGEFIELDGDEYEVESIGWNDVCLINENGNRIIIPNDEMLTREVINLSRAESTNVIMNFRVLRRSTGDHKQILDLEALKKDMVERIRDSVPKDNLQACDVYYTDVANFSVDCEVECCLNMSSMDDKYDQLREKIVFAVNAALTNVGSV